MTTGPGEGGYDDFGGPQPDLAAEAPSGRVFPPLELTGRTVEADGDLVNANVQALLAETRRTFVTDNGVLTREQEDAQWQIIDALLLEAGCKRREEGNNPIQERHYEFTQEFNFQGRTYPQTRTLGFNVTEDPHGTLERPVYHVSIVFKEGEDIRPTGITFRLALREEGLRKAILPKLQELKVVHLPGVTSAEASGSDFGLTE